MKREDLKRDIKERREKKERKIRLKEDKLIEEVRQETLQ